MDSHNTKCDRPGDWPTIDFVPLLNREKNDGETLALNSSYSLIETTTKIKNRAFLVGL